MQITNDYIAQKTNLYIKYNNKKTINNTNFTGIGILGKPSQKAVKKSIESTSLIIADILNKDFATVHELLSGTNLNRRSFMRLLANGYNERNFFREGNLKENSEHVLNIFKTVKKPTNLHIQIVSHSLVDFEYLEKLFSIAKDKKSLQFFIDFQKRILKGNVSKSQIPIDMLKSENRKLYIKSFDDFIPYIKVNINNPKAIEDLDYLIKVGKYNKNLYQRLLDVQQLLSVKLLKNNKILNQETLEKYYTKSGYDFISEITEKFYPEHINISDNISEKLLNIYKSTNEKNYELRCGIMKKAAIYSKDPGVIEKEFTILENIFERVDTDDVTSKFINKIIPKLRISSAQELQEIIDLVPAQKGAVFYNNVINIINVTEKGAERTRALKEDLCNPLYMPERLRNMREMEIKNGYRSKENRFSILKKIIANKINEVKYSIMSKRSKTPEKVDSNLVKVYVTETKNTPAQIVKIEPIEKVNESIQTEQPKLKLSKTFKKAPNAKKLQLVNDIKDIIRKKLGQKTLEKQQGIYEQKATKMRLGLLSEMFDSIRETRKADKLAGKKHSRSENKNVVELYQRINGSNRKLIRYMLKKTNTDGTRMFEVKDIIEFIDRANAKIEKNKLQNPDYKTSDAKAYYQHLFESLNQQYGKLTPAKKTKKK